MPVVHLGNPAAQHHVDGEPQPLEGSRVTSILIPDSYTRQEAVRTVWHPDGIWSQHSTAPSPEWVESDDPELAAALAAVYGCPVGQPITATSERVAELPPTPVLESSEPIDGTEVQA